MLELSKLSAKQVAEHLKKNPQTIDQIEGWIAKLQDDGSNIYKTYVAQFQKLKLIQKRVKEAGDTLWIDTLKYYDKHPQLTLPTQTKAQIQMGIARLEQAANKETDEKYKNALIKKSHDSLCKLKQILSHKEKTQQCDTFPSYQEFISNCLGSWEHVLRPYTSSEQFKHTYDFISNEYKTNTVYPPAGMIFNAFQLTSMENLKVVIVGQDPYHQPNQAMGLAFSVAKGVAPPPSLQNIFKCISNDTNCAGFVTPEHGDLTDWAKQGVLLLNATLTVQAEKPHSHVNNSGWGNFTDQVIKVISDTCESIIFLLWGGAAQKKTALIDKSKHYILEASHPSPLSAHRGFLQCQHFSKVNQILTSLGKNIINWQI